jgi:voltage-gated potassium channel
VPASHVVCLSLLRGPRRTVTAKVDFLFMSQHPINEMLSLFGLFRRGTYRVAQYLVLAVGLAAMIAMTTPALRASTTMVLTITLWCCLGFFAAELMIKSWPSRDVRRTTHYLFTAAGIIDLFTVLPIPLALLLGAPAETAWLLASLWLLKLTPVVPGLSLLGRVMALEVRPLASVFVIFLIVLLLSAVLLHVLEGASQPAQFGSLPRALWWAVTTLTTTGYGDAVPQTFLGRVIAGLVMICGLGVFGLWTGILATGFAAEQRRRDFIQNWDLVTSVPFLRNLDAPSIIELTRMLRRLDLAAHNIVVRRGRPGDCMYFIASGEVEVRIEPQPVHLGAGSFFGEFALLDGSPRTATVVTTMPSTFLILDVSDFRAFTAHHPELAQAVEVEAARRRGAIKTQLPGVSVSEAATRGKPRRGSKRK